VDLKVSLQIYIKITLKNVRVSYKGITLVCQTREAGSFPATRSNNAAVAQLVEQLISNHQVGGSNPSSSTIKLVDIC
jgi:hypothetical protein